MHIRLVICLLVVVVGIYAADDKNESFDIDTVLKSERLVKNYIKCLLRKGPCTAEGRDIKKNLANTLKTACIECTANKNDSAYKIADYILNHKHAEYKEIEAIYDPAGSYKKRYNAYWTEKDPTRVIE